MTNETRLLLLRHGAVAPPWPDRIYGRLDVPLSQDGEREAGRIVAALADQPLGAVVSSGLARAEFTAAALRAPRGLERRDDPRLTELDRGPWAGRERVEIARSEPDLWARSQATGGLLNPPGGEAVEHLLERVRTGLDATAKLDPGGQVAVVAHLWVLRAAAALVLGLEPARLAQLRIPTGGLLVLDWAAGAPGPGPGSRLAGLGADAPPPPLA